MTTVKTKLDKHHHFAMYTMWVADAAVAHAAGDYETSDSHYWMAYQCAKRLGLDAPLSVVQGAEAEQRKIEAQKTVAA